MNEPTVFGGATGTLPDCVRHDWDGNSASHAEAHNVYGLQMARACADGIAALRPQRRTFVMTRSGWAGLQRYAMNWMGDNISDWDSLRLTAPMIANLGISGLAFTGPDTGGFAGDCPPELLTRWLQLGVFTPFLRNHSALATAAQEPWALGEPYECINRRYHRVALSPAALYLHRLLAVCFCGLPMLRPLCVQWQQDEKTHSLADEFMFGDALLVAPVGEPGVMERDVYLPAGRLVRLVDRAAIRGQPDGARCRSAGTPTHLRQRRQSRACLAGHAVRGRAPSRHAHATHLSRRR